MRHDHHTGATYVRSRRADDNKQHMSQTVSSSFHRPVSRLVSTCLPTHIPAVFQPPVFACFFGHTGSRESRRPLCYPAKAMYKNGRKTGKSGHGWNCPEQRAGEKPTNSTGCRDSAYVYYQLCIRTSHSRTLVFRCFRCDMRCDKRRGSTRKVDPLFIHISTVVAAALTALRRDYFVSSANAALAGVR